MFLKLYIWMTVHAFGQREEREGPLVQSQLLEEVKV